MNGQEPDPGAELPKEIVMEGPDGETPRPISVWFLGIVLLLFTVGGLVDTILTEGESGSLWIALPWALLGIGVFVGMRWALLFFRGVWVTYLMLQALLLVILLLGGDADLLGWWFVVPAVFVLSLVPIWHGSVTAFCKKRVWKEGVRVAEDGRVEYPTRPVPWVLFGCLVSVFLPGAGHLVLGYAKLGARFLGIAAVAFALGMLFGVLGLAPVVAALPLFFVWLFAIQDLYAKGTGRSGSSDQD